jgi:ATP-dependent exoDNAse (exonuclease V) beta subunit (contains helicase and exonuclease domains)
VTNSQLKDQQARQRICDDLDTSLIVEAAAGTGKTTALIGRILSGIINGRVSLGNVVAVTFTEFAAGELKLRLRSAIEDARQHKRTSDEEKYLTKAVEELEEARIGTIHAFCGDLLREHPVEAGIDPLFEVAPDDLTFPLFNFAFERWFEQQLGNPDEGVRRILRRLPRREFGGKRTATLSKRPKESGPKPMLRRAVLELLKERDFTAKWKASEGFERDVEIDVIVNEIQDLGEWSDAGVPKEYLTRSLAYLKHFAAELMRPESLGNPRDYDGIEARLFGLLSGWGRLKDWKAYFARDSFPADELRERRDALKVRVEEFIKKAGADLAPKLREELWPVIEDFERLKERIGYLDFLDLLVRARNLIRDNLDVRVALQRRFTHIFVDEFQDTDPLQSEILMLLAADDPEQRDWRQVRPVPGKLFVVGDPKQSIYRFRRADVALYQQVKHQVVASGGAVVDLNVSFRSVPEIQQLVNNAFEPVMSGQSLTQAHYVPLAPSRTAVNTQPAIIALPVSQPYADYGKVVKWKVDESLPNDVASFVNWLVNESKWTVTERGKSDERVPLQARHVCLLFRRFRHYATDVTRGYVEALENYQIPHLLVGGSSFHSREEVETIRNALTAIEWPGDDLAIFATLRGPLFAFTDGTLLSYRILCKTFHLFKQPPDDLPETLSEVKDALAILRELHRKRNRRPIAETIQTLLAQTRAHAGFANWSTGEQALANIMRLTDMARRAERNGLISFRAFVDWLDDEAESGEVGDAPIMEEGVDGVRIMTVHKAKGLEFPVVILCDLTAKGSRDEPSKWIDQAAGLSAMSLAGCTPIEVQEHADEEIAIEKEEAARVLYVAATRARDLLVVCAVGDQPTEDWLATLNPVLYPPEVSSFNPETKQASGCPLFSDDTVVGRPQSAFRPIGSVSPGLHKPRVGEHRVVWWDPSVLAPPSQGRTSSKLTEFLKKDDAVRAPAGIREHEEWQSKRKFVREVASKPQWSVVTATSQTLSVDEANLLVEPGAELVSEVSIEQVGTDYSRPHGKRFGTLVHSVLSVVALDADNEGIVKVARVQGRVLGASEEEVEAAVETVAAVLRNPIVSGASGRCRREVPVTVRLANDLIVEGVVDLAYQVSKDGDVWTVVDYKTDFELGGRSEEYSRQVWLYALAISRATGKKSRPVLLRV